LQLALWVTGVLLVVAFPLAWLFAYSRRAWVAWLESLLTLPLVLSPTVLGFYLLLFLGPLGLAFSFPAIVVAGCVSSLPLMLSSLKTGLAGVPPSLREASATLGKGKAETFLRIVLPNMKTGLLSGIVLTFAHTLGEFGVVLMIGGSLPGVTKVVSIAIYEKVETLDFASAHAYALELILVSYPALLLLNFAQRRAAKRSL